MKWNLFHKIYSLIFQLNYCLCSWASHIAKFQLQIQMFWAVSDIVMLYSDKISVSFTMITKSSSLFKHIFKEEKYFVVYSDSFWSINWNWSPIGLSAIKAHSKRKPLSQSTYTLVCMNKKAVREKRRKI